MKWNQVADGTKVELLQTLYIIEDEDIRTHELPYFTEDDVKRVVTVAKQKGEVLTFDKKYEWLKSQDGKTVYSIFINRKVNEAVFKLLP